MQTAIFETELGDFGIGWTDAGVARVQLPGLDAEALAARLGRDAAVPGSPNTAISAVMALVRDYARGAVVDFGDVPLDLGRVPEFHRRAYELLVKIGWGETTTYGAMARQLGDVGLSRAVGQAMGANPIPLIIPCHRVLASDGRPGGFSAPGGSVAKVRMLALEGVEAGALPGQLNFGF